MATGLLLDTTFTTHQPGPGHPESPARYTGLTHAFHIAALATTPIAPRLATESELALAHTPDYIALATAEITSGRTTLSTGDTSVGEATLHVARTAVGSLLTAIDQVMDGALENAFCAVRPPGHHATADRGMGFCVFNSVAVAARYAVQKYRLQRIAIIDWDVHHGNGTQDIFYEDPSVYFFSTHQSPWYPGTGAARETGTGAGRGTTLNCPLPAASGMAEIAACFRDQFLPAMADYRPELILISAGFDSRAGDPLGQFTLTDPDFATLTSQLRELAHQHAGGRLISTLEGGYNVPGLASASLAHVRALLA